MEIDTPVNPGVTLDELLAAKEARARRQQAWLTRYGQPVISLSLVTPGPVKDRPAISCCGSTAGRGLRARSFTRIPARQRSGAWRTRRAKSKRCAWRLSRRTRSAGCGISTFTARRRARWGVRRLTVRGGAVCCVMNRRTPARVRAVIRWKRWSGAWRR